MKTTPPALLFVLMREPLVHFLLLGGLIFTINFFTHPTIEADRHINITEQDIDRLQAIALQQWGKAPTSEQLSDLVQSHIREEVLYRSAKSQGLDRDDVIVRRRLAQKMEFLANEEVQNPTDSELLAYYTEHPEKFSRPTTASFDHVFFSQDRHGSNTLPLAKTIRQALMTSSSHNLKDLGDPSLLLNRYDQADRIRINRDLGNDVATGAFQLPINSWSDPLHSPLGYHLIRVTSRDINGIAPFESVRDKVLGELTQERIRLTRDATYSKLLSQYHIDLPSQYMSLLNGKAISFNLTKESSLTK